jgi:hypothetical protein
MGQDLSAQGRAALSASPCFVLQPQETKVKQGQLGIWAGSLTMLTQVPFLPSYLKPV